MPLQIPNKVPKYNLERTKQQNIEETKVSILRLLRDGHEQIRTSVEQLQKEVQDNPLGLTPQEVLSGFGADAQYLLAIRSKLAELLSLVEIV